MPGMRFPGSRFRREERREDRREERRRRRGFNAIWALFWLILLIIVLGLLFGGYRKGTQINNPGSWIPLGTSISSGQR